MRGTNHTGFRIGHEHRQAVGREHAERHVLPRGHLAVGLDHCRLIRGFAHLLSGFALAARHVETERTVHDEQFIYIDGNAGMHLADQAQFRIDGVGERHTIGEHMVRIIAGFTPEIAVRIVAFAGAAKSRGVHDFDARRKHDRNGHRNRIAVHVGRVDRIAVKNRIVILLVSHIFLFSLIVLRLFQLISADFLHLYDVFRNYSALSVGFLVRDRMAAFTGTSCGHGMENTCAGLLMASTQCPSASRNPPAGMV